MRMIFLLFAVAVTWMLVSTYFDRTFERGGEGGSYSAGKPLTPLERAGGTDDFAVTTSQPVYNREINKARDVENQLQQATQQRRHATN